MSENIFNALNLNDWHSSTLQKAIDDGKRKEIDKLRETISILLDSERDLVLKFNGINDVDIERLIHYLKLNKIDGTEEEKTANDTKSNMMTVKLNEMHINEILTSLNIHEKINKKHRSEDTIPTKLWKFNRNLQTKENFKNLPTTTLNENSKIIESLDELHIKYKFLHNNKILNSNKLQKSQMNNKEIKPNEKVEPADKFKKKSFNFNRKLTL